MASPSTSPPFTVAFYDPSTQAQDGEGRTLEEILAFSDGNLEYHHDFIQYLFPLPERSPINPYAPVITQATRDAFLQRGELRQQVLRAVGRMGVFYGFEISTQPAGDGGGKVEICMRPSSEERKWRVGSRLWLTRFSHNHLRITRIIRSLRVLGMPQLAHGFHQTLLHHDNENGGRISARTKMYWDRAATRALHLAPEEEDDEALGVAWLRQEAEGVDAAGESGFDAERGVMAVLGREEVGEV